MIPQNASIPHESILLAVARRLKINVGLLTDKDGNREPWKVLVRYAIVYTLVKHYNWKFAPAASVVGKERTTAIYGVRVVDKIKTRTKEELLADETATMQRAIVDNVEKAVIELFTTVV